MKWAVRLSVIAVVVAACVAIVIALPSLPQRGAPLPTAFVTRGPLKLTVHAEGELRAGRTLTLVAPSTGGMLRIVKLVPTGTLVKAGDVVAEFDPADQQFALDQARSQFAEAEQEIVKMQADAAVQAAQDEVALLTARFDVRRAELDVSGNEFVGAIEAKKNELSLEEARRRLAQLEDDMKSRKATNEASLAVLEEKKNKARLAMQQAQQAIDSLVLRAPMDGVVSVKENRDATQFFFFGMSLPEYREGDSVGSGRAIADIIENGRMEVRASVRESDRANLATGQPATVYVDTLPGRTFTAKVGALAGLARRDNFWESATSVRMFDVSFQFDEVDPKMRAGASARVVIEGKEIPDALTLPRQAIFQRGGKTHVFVKTGDRFEPRDVRVVHQTESRAAIEGLDEGVEVALVDPTAVSSTTPDAAAPPLTSGGAR